MYKITKTISKNDGLHIGYGIKSENQRFDDISSDKVKIEELCSLCNRLELSEVHFKDVIEDFLETFETNS